MNTKELNLSLESSLAEKNILSGIKNYSYEKLISLFNHTGRLNVLIIGDAIIDEYAFGETLERTKKEPVLVFQQQESKFFAGGILAIANHVAEFCKNVTLLTCIGNDDLTSNLLKKNINANIKTKFFIDKGASTLIKKRYIEGYWNRKLFEVYNKEAHIPNLPESEIIEFLNSSIKNFDVVLAGDFGHGLISDNILKLISEKAKYLAINVQTNSGNFGFNLITKIPKADFVSITKEEMQLAMQDKKSSIYDLIKKLTEKINCQRINITMGKRGALYFDNNLFYYCPALSTSIVDTVGAGDAVFSITSLISLINKDPKLVPFLGNCAGALAIKIMGNEKPVKSEELSYFIKNMLNN